MTDIIYQRGAAREAIIWNPFQYNGPFNAVQEVERAIVFGLYANTYLHGHNYLSEIEAEDLAKLVDAYTAAIAKITNEEAQVVLEIAAKRYVEQIDQQIHVENLITRDRKIEALDDEYDARENALAADEEAIETKRVEIAFAEDKVVQKIKDLETRIELETVAQELAEVEVLEQELRATKADLALIQSGLKGLDIQLAITQTSIDITNTNLQITNAENEVDEIEIRVSETELQESGVDLDIVNAEVGLNKSEAAGARTQADTSGVGVRASEVEQQIVETEAKEHQIGAEIARIDADTARLALVDTEETIAQADKRIVLAENALLEDERVLIESKGNNVATETLLVSTEQGTQEELDGKLLENEDAQSAAEVDMSQAETKFEDEMKGMKVNAYDSKKDLADDIKTRKVQDADDKTELHDIRADMQEAFTEIAIQAARDLAQADIVNTLTHSIGQA